MSSATCHDRKTSQEQLHHHHQHNHHSLHSSQSEPRHHQSITNLLPTTTVFYCALIVFLLFKYKRQQRENDAHKLEAKLKQHNLKQMPRPPQMPIIGHLHLMRDYPKNPWDGFNSIREQWGDIVSLKMGVHEMVLISSVEYMNEALIRKGDIFADRPNFSRHHIVFGGDKENSLALCNWSQTHRARRKFCKRGVVPNKLSARNQLLESIISQTVANFLARLDSSLTTTTRISNNRVIQVTKNDLLFLTGDVFMKFLCDEERSHEDKTYEQFNIGCDFIFYDINQCYLLDFLPYLTSLGVGYSYLKQLKTITDYCRYYIDDNFFEPRRLEHLKVASSSQLEASSAYLESPLDHASTTNTSMSSTMSDETKFREDDYLDSIIKEQISGSTSMSLEDYKVGFADLLAGHAAVTNILMRLLGHLSLDEELQEMIHDEAKRTNLTNSNQLPPLPVTEAALKEAMRWASSPIVPHVAREDTSLGDYYVPKGSAILFNCYNVNLTPELWQNPRDFDPRRFLISSQDDQGQMSYKLSLPKYFMPFSVGQRQCLGYKMVESISVMATANICAKFKFKPNNEQLVRKLLEPKGTVALSPLEECFEFDFEPRQTS